MNRYKIKFKKIKLKTYRGLVASLIFMTCISTVSIAFLMNSEQRYLDCAADRFQLQQEVHFGEYKNTLPEVE